MIPPHLFYKIYLRPRQFCFVTAFTRPIEGAGRSSEVERSLKGAMGRRIDPSWGGPI